MFACIVSNLLLNKVFNSYWFLKLVYFLLRSLALEIFVHLLFGFIIYAFEKYCEKVLCIFFVLKCTFLQYSMPMFCNACLHLTHA